MADTRDRIITATNELFRRQGFHGTGLKQISEASGATTGSIYHFFPGGKEALTAAVIESTGDVYRRLFEAIADDADDVVGGFRDMFTGAAAVLVESDFIDPCPIGTIAREVASTNDTLRAATARAFESWTDAAARRLRHAGIDDASAQALARSFVAAMEGAFVLSRAQRSPQPMLDAGDLVASAVAGAVQVAADRR